MDLERGQDGSIVIRMPDGKQVRFGQEFTDEEIRALIADKYPDVQQQRPPETAGGDDWERAVLLPMETNRQTGERRWAVPGFVQGAIDAAALPGDVATGKTQLDPRIPYSEQDPETLDRAAVLAGGVAGEAPLAARGMTKATARQLRDASGKPMPKLVADDLEAAGIGPTELRTRLHELGPSGVVGDVTPRLQARVGAIANTPGPGQDLVIDTMRARAKGANSRIKGSIEETFGPEPIPSQVRAEIDASRKAANRGYEPVFREKALSDDYLYDAQPVARAIADELPNFVGETRTKVKSVFDMLVNPETGQLTNDPQVILAVRHELDGMIGALKDQRGSKTTLAALSDLRKIIDDDLATQVPGIKWVDARRADIAAEEEGFQLGRDALRGGAEPMHPVDLEAAVRAADGPKGTAIGPRNWIPQARKRISEGALSKIYETVGVTANDRVAVKSILKGDGSWNRDKMVTLFGEEKAKKLIDLLDAEAVMAQTEMMAFGNSKTEAIRSAKAGIEPAQTSPGTMRSAANLQFGDAAASLGSKVFGGVNANLASRRNEAIARALLSGDGFRPAPNALRPSVGVPMAGGAAFNVLVEEGRRGGVLPALR